MKNILWDWNQSFACCVEATGKSANDSLFKLKITTLANYEQLMK